MINSECWSNSSVFETIPNFPCPTCNFGNLIFNKTLKIENETADPESQKYTTGSDLVEMAFCLILRCDNNEGCNDSIVISGKRIVQLIQEDYFYDDETGRECIGNEGSHVGSALRRNELIEGYRIMEHLLEAFYGSKKEKLISFAKKVNKNRRCNQVEEISTLNLNC